MDISLIHAGLAAGTALAALPVILHLFMKQTPKHVVFPALRLIRERQKRSRKKLRIKNWLLLLARMALVALMALALARPRLFSQTSLGDQEVPTAVGLVFDTSLSMGYKPRDKTLLAEAKERAFDILKKLPQSSQVFVIDSSLPRVEPPLSPGPARKRIEGLVLHAANRPLNDAVGQAYQAVSESDRPRHEVYVLTDLARSSWDRESPPTCSAWRRRTSTTWPWSRRLRRSAWRVPASRWRSVRASSRTDRPRNASPSSTSTTRCATSRPSPSGPTAS
jgi:aerotolerance regulator-like protein